MRLYFHKQSVLYMCACLLHASMALAGSVKSNVTSSKNTTSNTQVEVPNGPLGLKKLYGTMLQHPLLHRQHTMLQVIHEWSCKKRVRITKMELYMRRNDTLPPDLIQSLDVNAWLDAGAIRSFTSNVFVDPTSLVHIIPKVYVAGEMETTRTLHSYKNILLCASDPDHKFTTPVYMTPKDYGALLKTNREYRSHQKVSTADGPFMEAHPALLASIIGFINVAIIGIVTAVVVRNNKST